MATDQHTEHKYRAVNYYKGLKRRARKGRRAAKSSHPAQLSTKGQPGRRNGRQKWPEIVTEWRSSSAFGRLIAWRVETPRPADRWNKR